MSMNPDPVQDIWRLLQPITAAAAAAAAAAARTTAYYYHYDDCEMPRLFLVTVPLYYDCSHQSRDFIGMSSQHRF